MTCLKRMSKNEINFITGESYTLSELFSGSRRIIIPDLQRDYCWGDETNQKSSGVIGELVTDFIENLYEQFQVNHHGSLNVGLFYGYEVPANHIQLCDGQQRLTTLFLLLGMINKKVGGKGQYLISDFELHQDDKEPYLQYAIRESSLYFLSDLVCRFFIGEKEGGVENIRKADWYFRDYDFDPSIQSMLRALSKVKLFLDKRGEEEAKSFEEWLTHYLTFMYVDMETRKNGEETFVVINTTGEPLSATQNLKPLVTQTKINKDLSPEYISKHWEEIETWFWRKRANGNDTAEAGFNEFLRWVTIIEKSKKPNSKELIQEILRGENNDTFPYEEVPFETIWKYWEVLKWVMEKEALFPFDNKKKETFLSSERNKNVNGKYAVDQNDCFVLLPVISFVFCHFGTILENKLLQLNAKRLFQFFSNLIRTDGVSKAVNSLVQEALRVVDLLDKDGDIVSILDNQDKVSKQLLTEEEKTKLSILKSNPEERTEIEKLFWMAQSPEAQVCHKLFAGEIAPLIKWSSDSEKFSIEKFQKYLAKFDEVFKVNSEGNVDDKVRRALLTMHLKGYPRVFTGNSNLSFASQWLHWKVLLNDNIDVFKIFFDELLGGQTIEGMITGYIPASPDDEWAQFVQKEYLLTYCRYKNIRKDERYGWILIKSVRKTSFFSVNNLHLQSYLTSDEEKERIKVRYSKWIIGPWEEGNRIVIQNSTDDLVFDVWYEIQDGKSFWKVQFFKRNAEVEETLKPHVDSSWSFRDDCYETTVEFQIEEANKYAYPNVRDFLTQMIEKLPR